MSCDEFKADNAKLAPSKSLSNEPFLSLTLPEVGVSHLRSIQYAYLPIEVLL